MSGRTLLTADWVVGHDDGHHVLLRNGEIVFEKGEIVFVGHGFPGEIAQRRDYGRALVAPGFIDLDALSDLDTTILAFDNHPSWRKGRTWPKTYMDAGPYEMYSPEELVFQKRHAFARLIRNGWLNITERSRPPCPIFSWQSGYPTSRSTLYVPDYPFTDAWDAKSVPRQSKELP